jgi:phage-related protein
MAAVTAWAANTAYSLGDIRKASDIQYTGVHFKVVTAGTSGGSEPTWSSEFASQTTDNNVVWEAVSSAFAEVSKINPSNIIELFELELVTAIHGNNSTYRFHNGVSEYQGSNIVFNGNSYTRMPIEAEGFDYSGKTLPRPTLRISNLLGTITSLLLTLPQGLEGAKVTRIRTLERYIDDINFETDQLLLEDGNYFLLEDGNYISQEGVANPHGDPDTVTFPYEIFTIDRKSSENREVVEFELAADFDVQNVRLPKRQVLPSDFPGVGTFY